MSRGGFSRLSELGPFENHAQIQRRQRLWGDTLKGSIDSALTVPGEVLEPSQLALNAEPPRLRTTVPPPAGDWLDQTPADLWMLVRRVLLCLRLVHLIQTRVVLTVLHIELVLPLKVGGVLGLHSLKSRHFCHVA